jgi:hypothetical protein
VPTKPKAQINQFIAELKQLPKAPLLGLMKDKAKYFRNLQRNIGSEYLNAQFGWSPFIKDVAQITGNTLNQKKLIQQFIRDSGKTVRRRYDFGQTTTMNPPATISGATPNPVYWNNVVNPGLVSITSGVTSHVWFSAAYTYYVPPVGTDWLSNIKQGEAIANHLYGTRIDPALLWELSPWSWLADYFGNVGDIVNNFTRFGQDNLCAKYAYVMCEDTSFRTYTWSGTPKMGSSAINTSVTCLKVLKRRARCNPYGFALNASLTPNQAAIVGALGLSRTPTRR